MCQAHGTECIFPRPDDNYQSQVLSSLRKSPANVNRRFAYRSYGPLHARTYSVPHTLLQPANLATSGTGVDPQVPATLADLPQISCASGYEQSAENPPNLVDIVTEAGDDSSHVVSPAVAGDNAILESYLCVASTSRNRCLATRPTSTRPMRPVRFDVVPRRPLGVATVQSLAASKCEVIEKYLDPDIEEYLNLFFQKANTCFPVFDEASFRTAYFLNKEKISSALICSLYANSLVYWRSSPKLRSGRTPDIRFIWNQANEALNSELFLSPGLSTVISIIINVSGRPSTSMFGNGGMVGTAVALSNALGLNRDPSSWDISPLEKALRIRIWWLVVIHDRWCSLAYGTPLQVHRAQYDVPFPSVDDLCSTGASAYQRAAASIFVALTTLTDVLARYLEHVYCVSKHASYAEMSAMDLEQVLSDWEESLADDVRRLVIRGTNLDVPGAANFRLAYLAVKLLLRRIQLDLSNGSAQTEESTPSPLHMHAQRSAEDITHLIQELDETQLQGFWIPVHAFSITSATMFLLRSGLRMKGNNRNTPLHVAKDMINTLQAHRQRFDWDIADNCLAHCSDLVEKLGMDNLQTEYDLSASGFPDLAENDNIDPSVLEDLLFGTRGLSEGFVL
ncbi:hypothetical protein N7516_007106 [Penicillium verrucosum]|uniref:uncharacterized protein n=1 Tax=Penicillium verrucosum TaxID=60171 RepID=UPI002544E96A|nr:uncharacterized protein N7516_007106 [Penicillium verrucosum]KAJ5932617.1 hypothetical protein N7516_007106 [Penicillium verrucosum]